MCRKESIASSENVSSSCSGLSSFANMAFIVVARVCAFLDVITSGFLVNIHVGGHLVKASWGRAQSTSGLCAWSQSVPNIMS